MANLSQNSRTGINNNPGTAYSSQHVHARPNFPTESMSRAGSAMGFRQPRSTTASSPAVGLARPSTQSVHTPTGSTFPTLDLESTKKAEAVSKQRTAEVRDITAKPIPLQKFAFANFLQHEFHFGIQPTQPVCQYYMQGHCPLENDCPDRHPIKATYQNLVCKHWLRGLCKKGDQCDFLHEYNLRKMPECSNFSRNQICMTGDACLYPHLDPSFRRPVCPHYERGFCPLGQLCANKHLRRPPPCPFYMAGFCPDGMRCEQGSHPKFPLDLPPLMTKAALAREQLLAEQQKLAKEQQNLLQQQGGGMMPNGMEVPTGPSPVPVVQLGH